MQLENKREERKHRHPKSVAGSKQCLKKMEEMAKTGSWISQLDLT